MKKHSIIILLSGLFAVAACSVDNPEYPVSVDPAETPESLISESSYQSGLLYVKLTQDMLPETKSAAFAADLNSLGVTSFERMFPDAGEFEERHRRAGLDQWYIVNYSPVLVRTKAVQEISELQGVEAVESPYKIKPTSFNYFNDPYSKYHWNYYNDGTLHSKFKSGCDINVVPVWENYTAGSKDIIVAVVDGAPDPANPDLAGVIIPAGEDGSKNFVNDSYELEPAEHGTHVSGTIAAINNNGTGVCGVAGGSDGTGGVRILSCQIFNKDGKGGGNSAAAIVWAADHGATIVNNSWGYDFDSEREAKSASMPPSMTDAIDYFVNNAGLDKDGNQVGPMKGGVVFFAAGNDGWAYALPASYDNVVSVGAYGPDFKPTYYSNYGPWCDISAPGGTDDIGPSSALILSTGLSGSVADPYVYMMGTSMACPHVTGVAALILSYYGGPGFTNEDLKARLLYGANFNSQLKMTKEIGPMMDAYGAMTFDKETSLPEVTFADPELEKSGITIKSHEVYTFVLNVKDNSKSIYKVVSEDTDVVSYSLNEYGNVEVTIDALKTKPGKYQETVKIGFSDVYSTPVTFNYTVLENHPPKVSESIDYVIIENLGGRKALDLGLYFLDEDGETLSYQAFCAADNIVSAAVSGGRLTLTGNAFGQTDVTVKASDARGKEVEQKFVVLVYNTNNQPFVGPNPVESVLKISKGAKHDFNVTIKNAMGKVVYQGQVSGDYFNPATIDMSSYSPGKYGLEMEMSGSKFQSVIIKK